MLGAGRPYHDSQWLFQAAAALAERAGGMAGVQALMVALWVATLAACCRMARRHLRAEAAALLALLVLLAALERILPRPELVTFAALAWYLAWLGEADPWRGRSLARLAFVQVLWTNAHGLFVLGPVAVGCHALVDGWRHRGAGPRAARRPALALGLTLLASLLNPWGPGAWRYAALLLAEAGGRSSAVVGALGELSSPFGVAARSSPAMWVYFLLLAAVATAALRALRKGAAAVSGAWLVVLTTAALSLTGRRNVVLFAIAAVPVLAEAAGAIRWPAAFGRPAARLGAAALLAALAAYPLSGKWYLDLELPARTGLGATPSFFPYALPELLDRIGFAGPVLAANTLGGFVSFHGAPATLPLTDGRWEIQDPRALERVLGASRTPGAWRALVAEFGLRGILLAHTSPEARALVPDLARDPAWRLVYLDAAASFWLPERAGELPPRLAVDDRRALAAVRRPEDGILLAAFCSAAGAPAAEAAALERALALGGRRPYLLERIGLARLAAGDPAAAEAAFGALLALDPDHEIALNELAFLAFRRGDFERAAELTRQLVEVAPANEAYRENLERVEAARAARDAP